MLPLKVLVEAAPLQAAGLVSRSSSAAGPPPTFSSLHQPTLCATKQLTAMAEENYLSTPDLSPLEQEVLDEYERLANNMKQLATLLDKLASNPTTDILDGLRDLERKTSMAFTLLKASVYSIVLQQEIDWGAGAEDGRGDPGQQMPPTSSAMGSDYDD
ncbi:hypothetical protein PWT90_07452 [Aphanocladium album]|nr:hypothetical protein PWT90_07452 [Aphanocladium album]